MKKTEKKHSIFIGFLTVLVVLFGGYFGNSVIDHSDHLDSEIEEEFSEDQKIENNSSNDAQSDIITYQFRSEKLWQEHYEKHGIEMGFNNKEDYLLAANKVIENKNVLHKLEKEDGDDVYYLEETNEFVIVSTDGYLRTYFNPSDGIRYFNRK